MHIQFILKKSTSSMTTGRVCWAALPWNQWKLFLKKQSPEDSGNSPKCKQKINKCQFNKIYENSVRKAKVWYLNQGRFLLSLLSVQRGSNSTPDCCSQEHGAPTLPRSQVEGFLPRRSRASVFLLLPLAVFCWGSPPGEWVLARSEGSLFRPNPTHGMRICIRHGTLKIVAPQ